jgi:hypothetical protein
MAWGDPPVTVEYVTLQVAVVPLNDDEPLSQEIVLAPSLKTTVPVGVPEPVEIVAVYVTCSPATDGLSAEVRWVVVACWFCTVIWLLSAAEEVHDVLNFELTWYV